MSDAFLVRVEILFNIAYLAAVWALVGGMFLRRRVPSAADAGVARLARWAFLFLAVGDTGHVGLRVWAYAQGSLDATVGVLGRQVGAVGAGALATAVTVTVFYALVLAMWRGRFDKPVGWFGALLLLMVPLRLLLMVPAGNAWDSVVPPQPWSLYRNLPLVVLGLGTAGLILRDARAAADGAFLRIGALIVVSFACYVPVILFVQRVPAVGMLMIPKTLAYLAIAVVVYRAFYRHPSDAGFGGAAAGGA